MPLPIEDYALISNCHGAALVGSNGSIDWMCLPRFDSPASFAALLGGPEHGRWLIAPVAPVVRTTRRYREGTLILETDLETADGAVRITDCMGLAEGRSDVLRIVEGLRGTVRMHLELVIRFDYGHEVPWVHRIETGLLATAGPDTLELHTRIETRGEQMRTVGEFEVASGERVPFVLSHRPSHEAGGGPIDAEASLQSVEQRWHGWADRCTYDGRWRPQVLRSLLTLRALIYMPTGGIVAAPTTSLPEFIGGVRNWDYRFCWLRDASFTLNSLLLAGFADEGVAWCDWLLRAVAGSPADLQILYSIDGTRRVEERELEWLPGYFDSAPVRIGNAAALQFQLDVYGEVMDTFYLARAAGMTPQPHAWRIQLALMEFLAQHWRDPDEGIWEVRGPRRHFVHSKVMAWVAFDRGVKSIERFGLEGPLEEWKHIRDEIHAQVCERGFDAKRNRFVQHYDTDALDASVLLLPLVGFLPGDDARIRSTVEAIERELMADGLVLRYATETGVDQLPPGEGAFLPCSFWLVDCLVSTGRPADAEALFERLLGLANDLGLLAEEVELGTHRFLGNFPQALTHMALVNSARLLSMAAG